MLDQYDMERTQRGLKACAEIDDSSLKWEHADFSCAHTLNPVTIALEASTMNGNNDPWIQPVPGSFQASAYTMLSTRNAMKVMTLMA